MKKNKMKKYRLIKLRRYHNITLEDASDYLNVECNPNTKITFEMFNDAVKHIKPKAKPLECINKDVITIDDIKLPGDDNVRSYGIISKNHKRSDYHFPEYQNICVSNKLTWAQEHAINEGYWPDGTGYRPDEY